jgi:anaerobic magnesium-protoporphyrin IX monomethyl ester cyclase
MRLHITLVNPPYPRGSSQHPHFPSLGLGYLAAVLEKNQHEVDVIDYLTLSFAHEEFRNEISKVKLHGLSLAFLMPRGFTHEEFRNEISKRQPDIVGITSTILTHKSALQIAKIAKEACPNCLTVLGGPHATFWDDKALQECPYLDIVVRKEGENTMLEIAERVEAGKDYYDVLGTTCRKDGKIVKNPDRAYIENLDDIPFPALHLWPIESLQKYGTVIFELVTSRGCVNWCNFCIEVRTHGRKYRVRSPKNVVDELEFLHNTYGAEYFAFLDDAFTVNQHRTEELCEEIRKRKLKIKWMCETRVDMITKELLLKMKEAGCVEIWFGVESGSQPVLDAMKKGISLAQIIRAFKWAKEVGLKPNANAILGFPSETKKTAWETIKFVEKLTPDYMGCYTIATPYPGTPMYDLVKKKGWLRITDFDKYDTVTPIFETPMLGMKELRKIREQISQSFYLRPTYVLRMFAKGGTHGFSATRTAFVYLLITIRSKLQRNNLPQDKSYSKAHLKIT